jgi:hypothetical protein
LWVAWESTWLLVSSQVMGFPLEYIYLVYFPPEYIYLVQSTSHSVFVELVVRVRYVHTHPLGFQHTLSECSVDLHVEVPWGNFPRVNNMAAPRYDVPQGDVYSDNLQGFPSRGATGKNTHSVHLFRKSKNISFPLHAIAVI